MRKSNIVLVLTGVRGVGKSTLANTMTALALGRDSTAMSPVMVCSADNYFVSEAGVYAFNPAELPRAHASCLGRYLVGLQATPVSAMDNLLPDAYSRRGFPDPELIIVDNTNTTNWERSPYMALAETYGWEPWIIEVKAPADIAARRNVHKVPEQRVFQMWERFEKPLPWWNYYSVDTTAGNPSLALARVVLQEVGYL